MFSVIVTLKNIRIFVVDVCQNLHFFKTPLENFEISRNLFVFHTEKSRYFMLSVSTTIKVDIFCVPHDKSRYFL